MVFKGGMPALAAAAVLLAGTALGHAKLVSSVPAADAELATAPTALTLNFNEKVQLGVLTLTAAGKTLPVTIDRNLPAAAQVRVALPALAAGSYQVHWSALSADDGHVTKGTFSFVVAAPATTPH